MADTYTVTGITDTSTTGPAGVVVPAKRVAIETKQSGLVSSVVVPDAMFTPEAVHEAASKHTAALEAVRAL